MISIAGIPTLETARLVLRGPIAGDAQAFMAFYRSKRSNMAGGPLEDRESWQAFAADFGHWALLGFGRFIVTLKGNDEPIGLAGHYAPHSRPEKEVGWVLLDTANEGQGYATEAAQRCIDHAWQVLGWDTFVSYINSKNDASTRLAERLGAVQDANAPQPNTDKPCLVYRHPRPEMAT
ncbi:MAG: GNAT family N-acetyltransferase [Paracoccaceae bacterium]